MLMEKKKKSKEYERGPQTFRKSKMTWQEGNPDLNRRSLSKAVKIIILINWIEEIVCKVRKWRLHVYTAFEKFCYIGEQINGLLLTI